MHIQYGYHSRTIISETPDGRILNWKLHKPYGMTGEDGFPVLVTFRGPDGRFPNDGDPEFINQVLKAGCAVLRGDVLPNRKGGNVETESWSPSYVIGSIQNTLSSLQHDCHDIDLSRLTLYAAGIDAIPAAAIMLPAGRAVQPAALILACPATELQSAINLPDSYGKIITEGIGEIGAIISESKLSLKAMRAKIGEVRAKIKAIGKELKWPKAEVLGERFKLSSSAITEAHNLATGEILPRVRGKVLILHGRGNKYISDVSISHLDAQLWGATSTDLARDPLMRTVDHQRLENIWTVSVPGANHRLHDAAGYATEKVVEFLLVKDLCCPPEIVKPIREEDRTYDPRSLLRKHGGCSEPAPAPAAA